MILSIGMIVKNEEKNLRKCLECIKPILDQVKSELIIADTGSEDDTVGIAQEFTDNVYTIEWKNDFAAARNTTIERAKGEWYMFLDADEFFEDVSEIIEFFNSGEYKKYKSARHVLHTAENLHYHFDPVRLFKKERDTKFIGKIHEHIPYNIPQKSLQSVSMHMGYVYIGEEGKKKSELKFERNLPPLLEMFEENPKNVRTVVHIVREYLSRNKWDDAKKYIDIGTNLFDKNSVDVYCHFFLKRKALYYVATEQYDKAVEEIRNYFETTKILFTTAIVMRMNEAKSLTLLERYDEAAEAKKQAFVLCEKNERGELNRQDMVMGTAIGASSDLKYQLAREIMEYYSQNGDFDSAIEWGERSSDFKKEDVFGVYIREIIEKKQFENIAVLYNYLTENFGTDSEDYNLIITFLEKSVIAETKVEFANILSDDALINDTSGDYIKLQKLRNMSYTEDEGLDEALDYFINSDKRFSELYGDIILIAMKRNIDFSGFLDKMSIIDTDSFVLGIILTNDGVEDLLTEYLKKSRWDNTCSSIKNIRIICLLAHNLFLKSLQKKEEPMITVSFAGRNQSTQPVQDEMKIVMFEAYVMTYHKYLSSVYKDEVFTEEMLEGLPEKDRAVYYAYKAYACKADGRLGDFFFNLKMALEKDYSMKDIIETIIEKYKQEYEGKNVESEQAQIQSQLDEQLSVIKNAIIGLIEAENYESADKILSSYEKLNPFDPDIQRLKDRISDSGEVPTVLH